MVWVSASSQSQIHLLDCVREPVNQSISTAAKIEAWLKTLLMIQMHKNNGKVMKKSFSKSVFPFFHLSWFHRKPSNLWERNHKTTNSIFGAAIWDPAATSPWESQQEKSVLAALPAGKALRQVFMFRFHLWLLQSFWSLKLQSCELELRGFVSVLLYVLVIQKCSWSLQNADSCRVNV